MYLDNQIRIIMLRKNDSVRRAKITPFNDFEFCSKIRKSLWENALKLNEKQILEFIDVFFKNIRPKQVLIDLNSLIKFLRHIRL